MLEHLKEHLRSSFIRAGLTYRQAEVALCASRGLSGKEIANELCIDEKTVKFHKTWIYKTLKVKTIGQFMVWTRNELEFIREKYPEAKPEMSLQVARPVSPESLGHAVPSIAREVKASEPVLELPRGKDYVPLIGD